MSDMEAITKAKTEKEIKDCLSRCAEACNEIYRWADKITGLRWKVQISDSDPADKAYALLNQIDAFWSLTFALAEYGKAFEEITSKELKAYQKKALFEQCNAWSGDMNHAVEEWTCKVETWDWCFRPQAREEIQDAMDELDRAMTGVRYLDFDGDADDDIAGFEELARKAQSLGRICEDYASKLRDLD